MPASAKPALGGQIVRYIVNGLVATAVHFAVLRFCMEVLHVPLAGEANAIAACFGIAVSFLGNRYFVFKGHDGDVVKQGSMFLGVYAVIALLHATVMYIWADRMGFDYRIGFVLATGMQMVFSFVANKLLVFK
jgi:putative flippase GtrA